MPIAISDPRQPDNPVVFVNDAFCAMSGYEAAEILGRNCRFLQGADTDPETVRRVRLALAAGEPVEADLRNYRKDGQAFWNRLMVEPVRDAEGKVSFFVASQVDVTLERARMAGLENRNADLVGELGRQLAALKDSESRLRLATEAGRLGIWELDLRDRALTTSASVRTMFGHDPEADFHYGHLTAAIHPDDVGRMESAVAASVASGSDYDIEYRVRGARGRPAWVQVRGQVLRGEDGSPVRLTGTVIDVTERKAAELRNEVLVTLDDTFRTLDEPSDLAFAAAEMLGRTLGVSRAGYGTIDSAAETITIERDWNAPGIRTIAGTLRFRDYGTYIDDLKRGETVVCADAYLDPRTAPRADALKAISAQSFINMPVTEGSGFVALLYLNHEHARTWAPEDLSLVREVAQRTRMAVQRRQAEKDLRDFAGTLEAQVAARTRELMETEAALRHSQKLETVGQLTGGVAHDFNNLLTVLRSSVDLLRRPNLAEERRRRYLDAISDTVDRAAKLTSQLLSFARRQALKPETFDAKDRVRSIADMLDSVTGARVRIVVDVADEPCHVRADASQFETALVNMAVNARDAMDGEGTLTLRVHDGGPLPPIRGHGGSEGAFVAVSLTDTGAGIAPERLPHIFEPFFTTKGVGKGTGLGLSQAFGFAKQSGGDIDVASTPGRGTTFTLYLPHVVPDEAGTGSARHKAVPAGGGRRVLVVEDNVDIGRFATQILDDIGYQSDWAANADEALARLSASPFDVVFSDVVMPGMNGVDLAREIRRRHPDLPVVLTSGYSHVLAEEGPHGFDLLHKPYSAEQLSAALRRATAS
nr:PAS domain-containing protein [Lichenibacterium sp. 6Y81]